MYRTHRLLLPIAMAGALLLSAPAGAGQASTSFEVSVTVGAACTLSASDLAFGTYSGTAVSGQTEIQIDCGTTVPAGSLTLNGVNTPAFPAGDDGFSTQLLDYDLYRDATHAQQVLNHQPFSVGPTSGITTIPIFGEIPAGQTAPDGSYSDTVNVVFNF